ncbi:MAG: ABC-2 type transport system ATP-binding protein [Kiritimatiellia bacterium]|jgi:ABC-2 type transport system ATP-binding protein
MSALVFDDVHKRFGRSVALDGLSFDVPQGTVCGLVGPNGAGKTTAFSIVCGYLRAGSGSVQVLDQRGFDPWALKGRLGVLPQDAELGVRHTPAEFLAHLARLQGLGWRKATREADRVLDLVRLTDRRRMRIASLSHGMRRRVAVASALLGDPELVLLDEPMAGLDPVQARSLRTVLLNRPKGQTIVISSHNLDELERLCDHVVMMEAGRCSRQGAVADVTGRARQATWLVGPGPLDPQALQEAISSAQLSVRDRVLGLVADTNDELDQASIELAGWLAKNNLAILEVRRGLRLEEQFFHDHSAKG